MQRVEIVVVARRDIGLERLRPAEGFGAAGVQLAERQLGHAEVIVHIGGIGLKLGGGGEGLGGFIGAVGEQFAEPADCGTASKSRWHRFTAD